MTDEERPRRSRAPRAIAEPPMAASAWPPRITLTSRGTSASRLSSYAFARRSSELTTVTSHPRPGRYLTSLATRMTPPPPTGGNSAERMATCGGPTGSSLKCSIAGSPSADHRVRRHDGLPLSCCEEGRATRHMCGIAGAIELRPTATAGAVVGRMVSRLDHRGPDDRGLYGAGPRGARHEPPIDPGHVAGREPADAFGRWPLLDRAQRRDLQLPRALR